MQTPDEVNIDLKSTSVVLDIDQYEYADRTAALIQFPDAPPEVNHVL